MRVGVDFGTNAARSHDAVGACPHKAILGLPGGRRVVARLAKMELDERKQRQRGWQARAGYDGRWMEDAITSAFKRLLGKALRAAKPEYVV